MKALIASLLLIGSVQSFAAQNLALSDFVGEYQLEQTVSGVCAPGITAELTNFLNQTAKESLEIFCSSQEECTTIITDENGYQTHVVDNLIYQFPNINTGLQSVLETNPMTGLPMGYHNSLQTLKGNVLTAVDSNRSLFGVINWKDTFTGKLEKNVLSFKKTTFNTLTGEIVNTSKECVYKKVK